MIKIIEKKGVIIVSIILLSLSSVMPAAAIAQMADTSLIKSSYQEESMFFENEEAKVKAETGLQDPSETPLPLTKSEALLEKLSDQLGATESTYSRLSSNIENAQDKLWDTGRKVKTLNGQLEILSGEIEMSENKVISVRTQISQLELDLRDMFEEIEIKTIEVEDLRRMLKDYLQLIYYKKNLYYTDADNGLRVMKLLLADASVSESLREGRYIALMEMQGEKIFDELSKSKEMLDVRLKEYDDKRLKLAGLNDQLTLEHNMLMEQKMAKDELYNTTKGQEDLYKQLLVYAKIEQQQVLEEIKSLETNVEYIKEKLNTFDDDEIDRLEKDVNELIKKNYLVGVTAGDIANLPQFSWPVRPTRGLSAYFLDGGYEKHFGMKHFAIDIPVPQGTPIHAPAPGVVTSIVDNGFGYSYIIVAHKEEFASLYGHVYGFNVKKGDVVHRGDILGLTGGVPGTKGAGLITTGAHLHFEVFKGGKQVDPLLFMPLRYIPLKSLPKKYYELLDMEQENLKEMEASTMIES
ncbi:peptidoglycan DD-metalloendopeptidase family protein, partial [Patescibacteria group bacterium]|nr:peptidoglycan DD-metalloendopeptidase family protein [Patescibacteria group bacterium]